MMDEDFLRDIERSLARAGYSDRSSFIRDAVFEKLATNGIRVDYQRALAPSRSGKGGAKQVMSGMEQSLNETPDSPPVTTKPKPVNYQKSKGKKK